MLEGRDAVIWSEMSLSDVLQVLRRRWLAALLGFVVVLLASIGMLAIQKPVYEATATLGLLPNTSSTGGNNPSDVLIANQLLSQAGQILPIYSEAVSAVDTRKLAQQNMPAGVPLASVSSTTFANVASIMRINAKSTSPRAAMLTAQAYVDALQTRSQAGDIGVSTLMKLQEVGSPTLPTTPVSPHKKLTIAIGVFLGLLAAAGAAWLREIVGGKVEDGEALAQAAGLPLYGEIPQTRSVPAIGSIEQWLHDDRLRFVNEAMRDLSLTLQLTQFESDSVLVTSPEGQHGKTTVSFGIAVALARSGVNTLLVDGDMRRGRLEQMFADEADHRISKRPGLADVLRGMPLAEAIQQTSLPNLSVLTSGQLLDDPSEYLDVAFPTVLREMERRSAVVIDGTPLVPINDARVIAKFVGSTVVVASAGSTNRNQVKRAVDRMRIIGIAPTAVILNKVRQRHSASYDLYMNARHPAPAEEPRQRWTEPAEPSAPDRAETPTANGVVVRHHSHETPEAGQRM